MLLKRLIVLAAVIAILPALAQNFSHSNMTGVHMGHANLTGVHIEYCNLTGADLNHANLTRAVLSHSNLKDANLKGADLRGADLRTVENLAPEAVKAAKHWNLAFYDDSMLRALGLPPDHNARLGSGGLPK